MKSSTTTARIEEHAAIRGVFDEVSTAWAEADAEAFAGWYTDSATRVIA